MHFYSALCGPSHLDTWDLSRRGGEIRGPYKPISTTVLHASASCTRALATHDQALLPDPVDDAPRTSATISMRCTIVERPGRGAADSPYIGSVLAKVRPSQKNGVLCVADRRCVGDPVFCCRTSPRRLSRCPTRCFFGSADNHRMRDSKPDVFQPTESPERMQGRRQRCRAGTRSGEHENWLDVHQRGFELATAAGPAAFKVDREDPRLATATAAIR